MNSPELVQELIEENIQLCFSVARDVTRTSKYLVNRRYTGEEIPRGADHAYPEFGDAISWAYLGMVDAARNFNVDAGFKFGSFAKRRISGAIHDGLRSIDRSTRLVRGHYGIFHDPDSSPEQLQRAAEVLAADASWKKQHKTFGPRATEKDHAFANEEDFSFRDVSIGLAEKRAEAIDELISIGYFLEMRERLILRAWVEAYGMRKIGAALSISESRVSQLLKIVSIKINRHGQKYSPLGRTNADLKKTNLRKLFRARSMPCESHEIMACMVCPDPEE